MPSSFRILRQLMPMLGDHFPPAEFLVTRVASVRADHAASRRG